ncbi:MAG TPA: DUF692 family protein, partial [Polyangiaceae bacterium]|nr:DUF692 family protein [Polyangiaceae bacterium]
HVAGHDASEPELLIDTHAEPVLEDVYALVEWVLARTGPLPVLLERDDNFPPWEELCGELRRLDGMVRAARVGRASGTPPTSGAAGC